MHGGHQPHPATPIPYDAALAVTRVKKRGNYICGRCGMPKKGHVCKLSTITEDNFTPICTPAEISSENLTEKSIEAVVDYPVTEKRRRRSLSFDDDGDSGEFPASFLWEVIRRLPPAEVVSVERVCRRWREAARRFWTAATEIRIRVPAGKLGFLGAVLKNCGGLVKLTLAMESDFDATMLACIAFSCPNLQMMEIFTSDTSVNRISGDELSRFIAEKRCLTALKIEGCTNLSSLIVSSTSLSTLWLSDLHPLSKTVFNVPNLKEISLDFSRQENDSTDLTAVMDAFRSCSKLQNIHIASVRLSHAAVLALTDANLRGLRMLSLVLGSEITDASVAAIASSYTKLELLDLSGSSISDSGIGIMCNVYPETLSKLLLALCPYITSSGIQFAAAQLPHLELLDCGMTICDSNAESHTAEINNECELPEIPLSKSHLIYQKLIIKHAQMKKLSLWGCSGLDAVYLNCPNLHDLNLNSCRNLHPERLLLQCPSLESVHASDCRDMLVKTIENQVYNKSAPLESQISSKRLPDGSKRVRLPYLSSPQPSHDEKKWIKPGKRQCRVIC